MDELGMPKSVCRTIANRCPHCKAMLENEQLREKLQEYRCTQYISTCKENMEEQK
jgi:hypothetical protein